MYGMITSLLTVLWIAAYTLLANPAVGQLPNSDWAPSGCTADAVCGDDPSVPATAPLERKATARRADTRTVEPKTTDRVPAAVKQ